MLGIDANRSSFPWKARCQCEICGCEFAEMMPRENRFTDRFSRDSWIFLVWWHFSLLLALDRARNGAGTPKLIAGAGRPAPRLCRARTYCARFDPELFHEAAKLGRSFHQ